MRRSPPDGYVRIGRLGRSFKVAGAIRLWLDVPDVGEHLDAFDRLFVTGLGETRVRAHETVSGALVVNLEGVRDRTVARSLVNAEVWAETSGLDPEIIDLLEQPDDEATLIGLTVSLAGARLGEVIDASLEGPNQYVEALLDDGSTVLLPLAAPYVTLSPDGVDLVEPPPGLLGDEG